MTKKVGLEFKEKENSFDGIFRYFINNGNIKDEVDIIASSGSCDKYNMLQHDNIISHFQTKDEPNSWIYSEFKNHLVISSSYIIRTINSMNNDHLKSWVIEGSDDNKN